MGIAVMREYGWWIATPGFLWRRDTRMSRICPSRFRSRSRSRYIHSTDSITPGSMLASVSSWRGGATPELAAAAGIDHIEHADALAHELPLDAEVRIRFRHHAHGPSRAVRGRALRTI